MNLRNFIAIFLTVYLSVGMAATPAIGVAIAKGEFRINNAAVRGNGTLLDGAAVETLRAASELQLSGGARMLLDSGSRGIVYRDRILLEKGSGQIRSAPDYSVVAQSLRVLPVSGDTVGRVSVRGAGRVQVAALRGALRVFTADGVPVASVAAGRAVEINSQGAGASAPSTITGCLVKKEGKFFLTDETAGVTMEVRGSNLDPYVGQRLEVIGATIPGAQPSAGASHVIQANNIRKLANRCASPAGAAAGGAAAGAGAATTAGAAGMSVATKAVIAGVIVAAAGTGTAVAVTAGDDEDETPLSR